MSEIDRHISPLEALSPLDGRYREKIEPLVPYFSEEALIRTRIEVETQYLIHLSETPIMRNLSESEKAFLSTLPDFLSSEEIERVKEIETTTKHDVKAMERGLRELVEGTSLEDVTVFIHFGLTSEDINNISHRLMLDRARKGVLLPQLKQVQNQLVTFADTNKAVPMLARTHGQSAVPTTLGKEFANMAIRLHKQIKKLDNVQLTGKLNGAVGNYNALSLAAPEVDWIAFSRQFLQELGLEPNLYTTQINSYDDVIELFQAIERINGVVLDIDQDLWRYISDDWVVQKKVSGEVGSSTMPQKVNPIQFENSEGNVQMANSMLEGMSRKLSVSRLQRDLSDSTTMRNVGSALGYSLLGFQSLLEGLQRIAPNPEKILQTLQENWSILTEGVQTVLRRNRVNDPYSLIASLSRGQKITGSEWEKWVHTLPIEDSVKSQLILLTPQSYLGDAVLLTEMAIDEISNN